MLNKGMTLSGEIRESKNSRIMSSWAKYLRHQLAWHVLPTLVILVGVGWFFLNVAESLEEQKHPAAPHTLIAHAGADMGDE